MTGRSSTPRTWAGRFITFEGVDGSGKSTQLAALAATLTDRGVPVVTTREPGGTPLGEAIRGVVLDHAFVGMSARAELSLYLASRAEHVDRVIRPALERGALVLCDRFTEATLAYQAYGRGLPFDEVTVLTRFAAGGLEPDLVVLLDLPVEDGLLRVRERRDPNRLDGETVTFHRRVREGYLALAAAAPRRFAIVDARRPIDEVRRAIWAAVEPLCAAAASGGRP
ncbi:MAG: dTMP kinase [Nitrospirota bacterium]